MENSQNRATPLERRGQHRVRLVLMHPVVFIGTWALLGSLFALQEYMNLRRWGYPIGLRIEFESWCVEFLIWGTFAWSLWRVLGSFIQSAKTGAVLSRILPLSVAICVAKEMIYVVIFPDLPLGRPHMPYWTRLQFHLKAEFVNDMLVFWCSFLLIRGLGYYQRSRESESIAAQLEAQLANAKLSALRMQLNPHFLFNALNSISSLMRTDVDAADEMLEQLSSLLRISLERGSVQMIPLRDEIDFVEVYLSMQDRRYSDRVRRSISVDPELHDAYVPSMLLQPIVENAYVHGLSKVEKNGDLSIEVRRMKNNMVIVVTNSGVGFACGEETSAGHGVGITNLRSRLQLHYRNYWSFEMLEIDRTHVRVSIMIPVQFSDMQKAPTARFGSE
jgi:two-component system LytT family sensor kinase